MLVKKLFSFLLCSTFALSVQSQLSAVDYKDEKFISFKASKTFIVKTGNEKFDSELLQAFKDSWKLTPYDVISNEEFETKVYLMPESRSESDDKSVTYSFKIVGIKPMISVGEWYDYVAYDVTILDASDNLKNFLSIVVNFFIKSFGKEDAKQKLKNYLKKEGYILININNEINNTLSYFGEGEHARSTMYDVYISDKLLEEIINIVVDKYSCAST